MTLRGIDISNWQAGLDLRQVPADFVIAKATEGATYTDPAFAGFVDTALGLGRLTGSYHYASGTDPIAEADHYLTVVGDRVGRILLALDWEEGGNASWGNGDWVRRFVNRVHERTGVWPLVYTGAAALGQIPGDVTANCALWVAQYASTDPTGYQDNPWNEGAYQCAMRQYTGWGRLPGWSGDLDLDKFYGSPDDWEALVKGDDMVSQQDIDKIAEAVWNFNQNGTLMRDRIQGTDQAANRAASNTDGIRKTIDRIDSRSYRSLQSLKRFAGVKDDDTTTIPDVWQNQRLSLIDGRVYRLALTVKRLLGIDDKSVDVPETPLLSDAQLDAIADRVVAKLKAADTTPEATPDTDATPGEAS